MPYTMFIVCKEHQMRIVMHKSTVFLMGVALVALSIAGAKAEPAPVTTTTEIQSPDGTTTTVIAPGAAAPQAVPPAAPATTGTTVVVDPPVAIDAITGKPVSNTTVPEKKEESLRDRVREKIEKNN